MDASVANSLPTDLDVIVPNLHWRYTGVTATNRMIAPLLAQRLNARWLGSRCARRHRAHELGAT